jgi:hypothetical protein
MTAAKAADKPRRATNAPAPASTPTAVAPPPPRRFTAVAWAASAALLVVFAAQALVAARRDSVTIDEFFHLPVGLNALYTGDMTQDPANAQPPRMFAALPLLFDPPSFSPPEGANVVGLGYHFMQLNSAHYQAIFVKARTMIVVIALVAACVTAKWAFDMYGAGAALASLWLFAFSSSLLAHGHLVTLDMAGTLGLVLALYANWWLLAAPSMRRAVLLGLAVGAANLLKLTGPVLVAMIVATWVIRIASERRNRLPLSRWLVLFTVVGGVALLTLNAGSGVGGTFGQLSDATLAPGGKLASLAQAFPWLRLPFPRAFVDGLDMVMESGKIHDPAYFLAGELSADGWWYYHLAAFAAKCPLAILITGVLAIGAWLSGRSPGARDYALFVPIALLFAANSAFNSLDIGERHVLAAYPLFFIAVSPWLAAPFERMLSLRQQAADDGHASHTADAEATGSSRAARRRQLPAAVSFADRAPAWLPVSASAVALLWVAAGNLAVAPRYLQYFNEVAGGPEHGHEVLIDSNIDWGQDLLRLREYMDANSINQIALAYFGRVDPVIYGIRYTPLERGVSHGKTVVSASFLMGRPYFWILGGRLRWVPSRTYEWLQTYRPIARVGSMFVFDVP